MEGSYWYIITGMATSFLLSTSLLLFYLKYRKNIIEQQYQLKVTELSHQKELLNSILITREDERKRIAIAIHDDIGNRLNILMLLFNQLELEESNTKNDIVNQAQQITDVARNISHSLYPVNLEEVGLILYVEELISVLADNISISFEIYEFSRKSTVVEVQLFRIIQEFTTNVLRHSNATEINIKIKGNQNNVCMILSDNGDGFDYNNVMKGMGLKNIESRISFLNGRFKWKNINGKGSKLIISV